MAIWKYIFSRRFLLVSSAMILSSIGANMIALALFLIVRPFSRTLYRRLAAQYAACMMIDALSLLLPGANMQITGDSDMPDGITAGIIVANHQYEGDWWFMLMVARFLGLHGNVKIIVREGLKRIPLLGWLLQLVEYPFISDSWSRCRTDLFSLLRSFTADNFPVLLFQFPEGDRIDAKIRQQSLNFAEKEKRPQLLHVLLPRTTGFNACIEALRTSHPFIYDMTIAFPGYSGQAPSAVDGSVDTFLRFCNGDGPREVHIRLKRYQLEEVLADPHWLDNRWAEKDRVLTYFGRTETFPAQTPTNSRQRPGHSAVGAAGGAHYFRVFNSRSFKAETSALALIRLCLTPLTLPLLLFMACPALTLYFVVTTIRRWIFPYPTSPNGIPRVSSREHDLGSGSTPAPIPTPFLPQTPFTSPLIGAFDLVAPRRGASPTNAKADSMNNMQAAHKRIRSFDMPASSSDRSIIVNSASGSNQGGGRPPLHKTHSNNHLHGASCLSSYSCSSSSGRPNSKPAGSLGGREEGGGGIISLPVKSKSSENLQKLQPTSTLHHSESDPTDGSSAAAGTSTSSASSTTAADHWTNAFSIGSSLVLGGGDDETTGGGLGSFHEDATAIMHDGISTSGSESELSMPLDVSPLTVETATPGPLEGREPSSGGSPTLSDLPSTPSVVDKKNQ